MNLKIALTLVALIFLAAKVTAQGKQLQSLAPKSSRPNFLFIAVDDLNHWVECRTNSSVVGFARIRRARSTVVDLATLASENPKTEPSAVG